jgi:hypothetical protein
MKIISGILLVIFASLGESVIINCNFRTSTWPNSLSVYTCWSSTENTGNLRTIEGVRGNHLDGRSNLGVQAFRDDSNKLQYIPINLANVFQNLKVIRVESSTLVQLSASDLKSFPNLAQLFIYRFMFTSIESDLFQYTKRLQIVHMSYGRLRNVGVNILNGLSQLTQVAFNGNTCIDCEATTPQMLAILKRELSSQCQPFSIYQTYPTTRPTTTTTTRPTTTTTRPATTTTVVASSTVAQTTVTPTKVATTTSTIVSSFTTNENSGDYKMTKLSLKTNS